MGQKLGVILIALNAIALCTAFLVTSFESDWKNCYLWKINDKGWLPFIVCFINIGIQYIMGGFFIDAARRIRKALKT